MALYQNRGLDLLWYEAVQINSNLFLLDKIMHFPLHIFVPMPTAQLCWRLIVKALYESCLMGIWRIVIDSGSDMLTLQRFRNELMKNAHESARHLIAKRLGSVDFDKRVAGVGSVIRELRNNWLAHLKEEVVVSAYAQGKGMPVIPLDRLKDVCGAVNKLIDALSFDCGRCFIYLQYSDAVMHPRERPSFRYRKGSRLCCAV